MNFWRAMHFWRATCICNLVVRSRPCRHSNATHMCTYPICRELSKGRPIEINRAHAQTHRHTRPHTRTRAPTIHTKVHIGLPMPAHRFAIMCFAQMCYILTQCKIRFCNSFFGGGLETHILQKCALQFFNQITVYIYIYKNINIYIYMYIYICIYTY